MITCERCNETKDESDFHKNCTTKTGYQAYCKLCRSNAKYESRPVRKQYKQKWYEDNKQRIQKHYQEHRDKLVAAAVERNRKRRQSDPIYKIRHVLGCRLRAILKKLKAKKAGDAITLLGCTLDELKVHLESQFTDGMTWDNYGFGKDKWTVDHILPLSSFDLVQPEQQLKANHYTNLQPMWCFDNIAKGNKIVS